MSDTGFWPKHDPRSEFEGRGVLRNGGFPKGSDALTPDDKLRLDSITGQDTDPCAEPNPWHWYGNIEPDPVYPGPTEQQVLDQADPYPKGY